MLRNCIDRDSSFGPIGCAAKMVHSKDWGYFPTGGLGLVLLIVVILLLLGRI